MFSYLMEASLCLICLYLFYWLVLSREKFLSLNRFYLLFSIVVSLTFPLITFNISTEVPEAVQVLQSTSIVPQTLPISIEPISRDVNLLSLIYWNGVSLSLIIFLIKIWSIRSRVLNNSREKSEGLTLIDTSSLQVFSFFRYVFINKKFRECESKESIIEHEKAHVKGLHSLDVTLMEFVKIVFWFNPIVYAYVRSLKLQHEYIADAHVTQLHGDDYEQTLIRHALVIQEVPLSSAYAQPPIKKRLKMINKTNVNPMKKLKLLVVIPLTTLLFITVSHSENVKAQSDEVLSSEALDNSSTETEKKLRGKVHDAATGKGLKKVTVFFPHSTAGTFTNNEGNYLVLQPTKLDTMIVFKKEGYETMKLAVKKFDILNVALRKKPVVNTKKEGN